MKSLFIILIILVSNNAFSQNHPFPIANASWVARVKSGCVGGSVHETNWTEHLVGDTIIDNKTYGKLLLQKECKYQNAGDHCPEIYSTPKYENFVMGVILEENEKVIFKKFNVPDSLFEGYEGGLGNVPPDVEILLYDMNWEVGDSVIYPVESGATFAYDVFGINEVNGRKHFGLQYRGGSAWHLYGALEGIGGKSGLFSMYYPKAEISYVCFIHNGELIYGSNDCTSRCELTNVSESIETAIPTIFPNPVDHQFVIQLKESATAIICIVDILGKIVLDHTSIFNTVTFDTSNWSSGIYFIMIETNGQRTIQKVIKR